MSKEQYLIVNVKGFAIMRCINLLFILTLACNFLHMILLSLKVALWHVFVLDECMYKLRCA